MDDNNAKLTALLQEFMEELKIILSEIEAAKTEDTKTTLNEKAFFPEVRQSLFGGRLKTSQVEGIQAKLKAFREAGFPLSWAAYALATSYHETAQRMQPVREGLSLSESWRKRNLRYYPYYGRGDVQLTWKDNYERADKELGLNGSLLENLDLALEPNISAKIMVKGMKEGWFSGNKKGVRYSLPLYLPDDEATLDQFTKARYIINLNDKAALIAGIAFKFQRALKSAGYGEIT